MSQISIISKFHPHQAQQTIHDSLKRFRIVKAGRRFGKSIFAVNECIEEALSQPNRKVWYTAPLYRQVKEIAWNLFLEFLPKEFIEKKNESELKFSLINGAEIALKGTDNPDSLLGVGLHFVVLDESAMMKPAVWFQIIRPMLVDTKGRALFISTPRGLNWFYDLWQSADNDPDFDKFHFETTDNKSIEGIEAEVSLARLQASSELDKVIHRQEYEASFEVITGRPRFDVDLLKVLYDRTAEPIKKDGGLKIFEEPNPLTKYIVGVDTSEGLITGDNSSVTILNAESFKVAAQFAGTMKPEILGETWAPKWASYYNYALIVVEDNNHGLVTINELKKVYKNLYYRKVKDEITDEWTEKIGWRTNARTKPLIISNLDKALRSGLKIPCRETIQELMTYVIEEDGSTNASEGSKDDRVMSLACAVQGYMETSEYSIKPEEPKTQDGTVAAILERKKEADLMIHSYQGRRYAT